MLPLPGLQLRILLAALAIVLKPAAQHLSTDTACRAQVPEEVFREVASPDQHAKLQQFVMRSFVEDNRTMTWCPAPGALS